MIPALLVEGRGDVQFARPISDDTVDAEWSSTGANFYTEIDDIPPPSDTDFIDAIFSRPVVTEIIMGLTELEDPELSSGHIFRVRLEVIKGSDIIDFRFQLRQGTTVIKAQQYTTSQIKTTIELTLSAGEADSITDYTDLNFRINGTSEPGGVGDLNTIACYWMEFEVPGAFAG